MKRNRNICIKCPSQCRIYDINKSRGKPYKRTVAWICLKSREESERKFAIKNIKVWEETIVPDECKMHFEYIVMTQKL